MTASLPDLPQTGFQGTLYRALNPLWHRDPLSGEGARRHGGRFNRKGRAALYTACDVQTALAEASQVGRPLQPTTLVSYIAEFDAMFDASDPGALAQAGMTAQMLSADDWRMRMLAGDVPAGQGFAERLIAEGFSGMIVPSFAPLAQKGARNIVLWDWDGRLIVNDDDGRLNP